MEKPSRSQLGVVAQFANYHIRSAVHFARLCYEAEEAFKGNEEDLHYFQHRAYVSGAIMLSVAFLLILSVLERDQLELGRNPLQDASLVIQLRNKLIHFEPEHIIPIAPENEDEEHKWLKKVKNKFPVNPIAEKMKRLNYPDILLGYGCARWAVVSTINFHDEFCKKIELPRTYSKLIIDLPASK